MHRIERLMRLQALKARPRRRRMQIREPELEVCLVVLPRQPVYTGRGVPFQLKEREPKEINADVVEERGGEPFLLPIAGETERTAMALFHHDTPLETPITPRGSIGDSSCLRIRQQRLLPRVRRLDQQRAAMSVGRRRAGPYLLMVWHVGGALSPT